MRCNAKTLKGSRCKKKAHSDGKFCAHHGNKKGNLKPSNAELKIRYATVAEMLIKGLTRPEILRHVKEIWSSSEATADNYISQANNIISESVKKDLDSLKNLAIARFTDLYKRNYTIQDYRECRQVQSELNKTLGINEPKKLDHVSSDKSMSPKGWESWYDRDRGKEDKE